MTSRVLHGGRVLTPDGERPAGVVLRDGLVAEVGGTDGAERIDVTGCWVVPGFVDLHVHAAGGAWAQGPGSASLTAMAQALVAHGTTAFLATSVASPTADLHALVTGAAQTTTPDGGARCLGVHLEGPWLSPLRAGAQPANQLRAPDLAEITALVEAGPVRLVTLAPELPGGTDAVRWLADHGVVVALGHSDATYADALAAAEAGATHVTHTFNAMRPLHHREPGLVGAALDLAALTSTEVIADGVHVDPAGVRLLWRARGADVVCFVSDGVDGCHDGGLVVDGTALRRPDGTLAGSALGLADAVRNAVAWGIPLEDAVRMASTTPARVAGRPELGVIRAGAPADLVVLDADLRVRHTIVAGDVVFSAAAA